MYKLFTNNLYIYFMAINKTKYRNKVEATANVDRGKIKPVLSHLKNLIFRLIIFTIYFLSYYKDIEA